MSAITTEGSTIVVATPAGRFSFPRQAFAALQIAAENPGLTNAALAGKMGVNARTYNNRLSEAYSVLGLDRTERNQRTAATEWYNRYVAAPRTPLSPTETSGAPHTAPISPTRGPLSDHQITYKAVLFTFYVTFVLVVFGGVRITGERDGVFSNYANLYNVVPFLGGLFLVLRQRDARRHYVDAPFLKADTTELAFGMIAWSIGGLIWLTLNLVYGDAAPYPSVADVGYAIGASCLVLGTRHIFGVSLRKTTRRLVLAIATMGVFASGLLAGMLYLRGWQLLPAVDPIKLALDVFYPCADVYILMVLYIFIAQEEYRDVPRGIQKITFSFLFSVAVLFIADLSFSITTTLPTNHQWAFYNGNLTDLAFLSAFFVMSISLLSLPYTHTDY